MTDPVGRIFGPRLAWGEALRPRYLAPALLLLAGAVMLATSFFLPYWRMTLHAPQYPKGLHVVAFLNRLEGDVREIDNLNHYIGMRPLNDAAQLERRTAWLSIAALSLLVLSGLLVHNRWAGLAALPAVFFPGAFLLDLHLWLSHFGQNLDPAAALSNSIKPFTPPVLGEGLVGQFRTVASPAAGLLLAAAASAVVLGALWLHRRAYKPLVEARRRRALVAAFGAAALHLPAGAAPAAPGAAAFDLQAVIDAARAGDVVTVPAGTYTGTFTIRTPMTLAAQGAVVLDGLGRGDVVQIAAPDVTLRGFAIRASGPALEKEHAGIRVTAPRALIEGNVLSDVLFGLLLKGSPESIIRSNTITGMKIDIARRGDGIRLWQSAGTLVEGNTVREGRDVVIWFSGDVTLRGNTVATSRYGMHFMYTDRCVLENNHLEDNSVGAFLMYSRDLVVRRNVFARNRGPSGYGLGLKDMERIVAEDNLFLANRVGAYLDNSPHAIGVYDDFRRNVFACNDIGLAFLPNVKRNRFTANTFMENLQQVAVIGTGDFSGNDFTVEGRGNFWSDYRGYDVAGDGLGDLPYRQVSLFESLMEREPRLRLFLHSPAQHAIDLAARAFPIFEPQCRVTDEAPLMRPTRADVEQAPRGPAAPMWWTAAGLLLTAASALALSRRPLAAGAGGSP